MVSQSPLWLGILHVVLVIIIIIFCPFLFGTGHLFLSHAKKYNSPKIM
jgi:hypothetical protein